VAFLHRRVFYGKVGVADKLVKHLKAGEAAFAKYGLKYKYRVLTDYNSGRTDRVVWEWEVASLPQLDADMNRVVGDAKARADFDKWFAQLTEMIHYAEVDNFSIAG